MPSASHSIFTWSSNDSVQWDGVRKHAVNILLHLTAGKVKTRRVATGLLSMEGPPLAAGYQEMATKSRLVLRKICYTI